MATNQAIREKPAAVSTVPAMMLTLPVDLLAEAMVKASPAVAVAKAAA
jgi:hypothetical protein